MHDTSHMAQERFRRRYTVIASPITGDACDVRVSELPDTRTVAFCEDELESRARLRLALDTGAEPEDFDIEVLRVRRPTAQN